MPLRANALEQGLAQQKDNADKEELYTKALDAIRASGLRANGHPNYSIRRAAEDYGVSRTTLQDRYNGKETRTKSHYKQRALTIEQEDVLAEWIKERGRRGIGFTSEDTIEAASKIAGRSLGKKWYRLFRQRHPELRGRRSNGLEVMYYHN
jgi:transposase